jgi:hypothetical protein
MDENNESSKWLIDWQANWEKAKKKFEEKYPFPAGFDIEQAKASTEYFARSRIRFPLEDKDSNMHPDFNPILPYWAKDYPLPIGWKSILEAYMRNGWDKDPHEIMPSPLVEKSDAYAGIAILRESSSSQGWFIGLVNVISAYNMPIDEVEKLSDEEKWILIHGVNYEFIDGIFLIEGKLDEGLFVKLKEVERTYNEKILGKIIRGRPLNTTDFSNDQFLELNISALKGFTRRPRQYEMAEVIHIDLRTYINYRQRCDFVSYESMLQHLYTRI